MTRTLADELQSVRSAGEILAGVALATWVDAHPTLTRRGYFLAGSSRCGEGGAGDSMEIVDRIRASRSRAAGLTVRASARFVEAARLAQLRGGKGFEYRPLTEWAGLPLPPKAGR